MVNEMVQCFDDGGHHDYWCAIGVCPICVQVVSFEECAYACGRLYAEQLQADLKCPVCDVANGLVLRGE